MRAIIEKVKGDFAQSGYRKRQNSFYKIENGFYKLINFQKGAYGDYFFINVGLYPVGLPYLQANRLYIPDHPKEYECVLRQRAEEIVKEEKRKIWSKAQNWIGDDMVPYILDAIVDIECWFQKWGTFNMILDSSFDEISKMFTCAPILWEKEYLLLKFYSALQVGNIDVAQKLFSKYSGVAVQNMNFENLDNYLQSMIVKSPDAKANGI